MLSILQWAITLDHNFWPFFKIYSDLWVLFLTNYPSKINASKYALNHFEVYSSAKDSLKSKKKRSIFFILHFGRQAIAPSPLAKLLHKHLKCIVSIS